MNLDNQILHHFGTSDLAAIPADALAAGIERMKVNLGLAKDRGERYALWASLHILGSAPDPDAGFKIGADREAARNFTDVVQDARRA